MALQSQCSEVNIIPPGVDTSHFYPIPADEARQFIGLAPDDRMILYVGRIEPLKGVATLLQAVACLALKSQRNLFVWQSSVETLKQLKMR